MSQWHRKKDISLSASVNIFGVSFLASCLSFQASTTNHWLPAQRSLSPESPEPDAKQKRKCFQQRRVAFSLKPGGMFVFKQATERSDWPRQKQNGRSFARTLCPYEWHRVERKSGANLFSNFLGWNIFKCIERRTATAKALNNRFLDDVLEQAIQNNGFTSVRSHVNTLNFCRIITQAILISTRASRMPMQFRGPLPKGIKAIGWISDFLSGENLKNIMHHLLVVHRKSPSPLFWRNRNPGRHCDLTQDIRKHKWSKKGHKSSQGKLKCQSRNERQRSFNAFACAAPTKNMAWNFAEHWDLFHSVLAPCILPVWLKLIRLSPMFVTSVNSHQRNYDPHPLRNCQIAVRNRLCTRSVKSAISILFRWRNPAVSVCCSFQNRTTGL